MRDLIVLLIRHNQHEEAERLLKLGMDCYPRYAEFPYLAALLCASKERWEDIPRYVRQATQNADPSLIGSGGESSYRSLWLLGRVFELAGNQAMALQCYLPGAQVRPAYAPSVFGILRQRVPYNVAQELRYQVLGALVRREPRYLEMIFEYFVLHRQVEPARGLLGLARMPEATRKRLQKTLDDVTAACRLLPRAAAVTPGVTLVGPFYVHSSLARINREIAAALSAESDFDTAFEPHGFSEVQGIALPHFDAISKGLKQRVRRLDLTIRQHWPPSFRPPACGKLVVILPWEYGSIPARWADQIRRFVDELWVPSEFCREVFIHGGVQEGKVHVIPYGVDPEVFKPEGPVWQPEGCRGFVFLFVGGAIARKGIDVLWNAYCRAFTSADDVTLVIKDIGSSTFYKDMTQLEELSRVSGNTRSPHLVVLTELFDDSKLASLYRGSNAVVLPYRGEGFGMPLAEGLACGRPVITTGLGPAREFCPPEASYFVSAKESQVPNAPLRFGPVSGPFTWFEPDAEDLSKAMRWVFEHREEAARRGAFAARKVRAELNWKRITNLQVERIRRLVGA
ncbi:MAG: glycosyltransferase family 4 protein [Acidobacteriota bacterium]